MIEMTRITTIDVQYSPKDGADSDRVLSYILSGVQVFVQLCETGVADFIVLLRSTYL